MFTSFPRAHEPIAFILHKKLDGREERERERERKWTMAAHLFLWEIGGCCQYVWMSKDPGVHAFAFAVDVVMMIN